VDTAIIIPVHNRRETTLRCLRALQSDGVFAWATIYVVDDGSTDGTAAAIQQEFPAARVLRGTGDLWWTGAIELGMKTAREDGADYFLWLNDDACPEPGACARLRKSSEQQRGLVTGQCFVDTAGGPPVYGGLRRRGMEFEVADIAGMEPTPVDATSGNFVCLPRAVVDKIGYPDGSELPHAFGDLDYTRRAQAAGFPVLADPAARATCAPNAWVNHASWLLSDIPLTEIWRGLGQKSSYAYAPSHARFLTRHFGYVGFAYWAWTFFKRVPITVLRLLVPQRWLRRIWGRHSPAWQAEQRLRR
jgi:GT2 family glycosyltransferase